MMHSTTLVLRVLSLLMVVTALVAAGSSVPAKDSVRVEEAVAVNKKKKDLSFFRHFGQTQNRNRRGLLLECDYDRPDKTGHCPPSTHDLQPFATVVAANPEEQDENNNKQDQAESSE